MARKKTPKTPGPSKDQFGFRTLFAHLWKDPKYVAIEARKERLLRAWNQADAYKNKGPMFKRRAERLDRLVSKCLKRLYAYEERARLRLEKSGAL